MQIEVVNARFNKGVQDYYFSPNGLDLKNDDKVIVETEKGKDLVTIVGEKHLVESSQLTDPLKNVLKKASNEEISMAKESQQKAEKLMPEIKKIVKDANLEMKIISVESNYNFSRLTINFTSENRVDFRELVKVLAEKYKNRIELRQIGARDATRLVGGLGVCGKQTCCSQGIKFNEHVSIKMAKNQSLSLNPNSISGVCGKLLCCLAYENQYYVETLKEMPKVGKIVSTPDGDGKVIYLDLIKKKVSVKFQNAQSTEIKTYELKQIKFNKDQETDDK